MKIVIAALMMMCSAGAFSQDNDRQLVEKAVLNYVDAFYLADTTLAYKSVVSDLAKRGYYKREGAYTEFRMTFPQLTRMASRWKENQNITPSSPRKVTVLKS